MTSIFLPDQQEILTQDMAPTTTLVFSLFFSSAVVGFYLYDLFKQSKATNSRLEELEHVVHETTTVQEAHADIIHEQDLRIREKQDYDEMDELEHGKYQAWIGSSKSLALTVRIWREKISTKKKNLEWTSWDNTPDGSCIVRDFYLGNSNPDFSWIVQPSSDLKPMQAIMKDTLINGWDSVCKIEITLLANEKNILQFVNKEIFEGSKTCNLVLKKCVDDGLIVWSRILLDA